MNGNNNTNKNDNINNPIEDHMIPDDEEHPDYNFKYLGTFYFIYSLSIIILIVYTLFKL
jgi:hypothetical protein